MTLRRRSASPVNMTDVAARAGVSQSTVSRVINNHPGISEKTRETVLQSLRLLGYKSEVMSLIQDGDDPQIPVILAMCPLPEQHDPFALEYFSLLSAGVREGVAGEHVEFKLQTLIAAASELPEATCRDGVILVGFPSAELRASLRRRNVPYVIASGDLYSSSEDMVTVNNFEAGVEGCRHLLGRGVKRIGFLLPPHALDRYAGFQTELLRNGISVPPEDFRLLPDTDLTTFIEAIHNWIGEGNLPEALVVGSSDSGRTAQMMMQLQKTGGVTLMAFDHHPGQPGDFITLNSDPAQIGRRAAKRLLEKIRSRDDQPLQIVVPMTLEVPKHNR